MEPPPAMVSVLYAGGRDDAEAGGSLGHSETGTEGSGPGFLSEEGGGTPFISL